MALYEIPIPFGRLEAESYTQLKLLIENEANFWKQFDFDNAVEQFRDDGFRRLAKEFMGQLHQFVSF